MSDCNGTMRRKPQLSESIEKLDEMIDDLSKAIPGAVGESIREALGPAFAAAIKDAVKTAVAEALREVVPASTVQPLPVAPVLPAPPSRSPAGAWARVKAALGGVRRWADRAAAPLVGHVLIGWAVAKLVGSATVRSRAAAVLTALGGTAAGVLGFALGPVGAAVLLGLLSGSVAAAALWAAPTIRLFVAPRDD